MFDHRLLDKALLSIGTQKAGRLSYLLTGPNPNLSWSLTFRLLGVYRWEIDGTLRIAHAVATPFAKQCLSRYAGKWWADTLAKHPEIGAGNGFPITNLTKWSLFHSLKIKDMSAEESASRVATDVEKYVLPFVHSVPDDDSYLDHVLADEAPMKWLYSQPLTRFAEAVKLSVLQRRSLDAAAQALERERAFANGQLQDFNLEEYAAAVVTAASGA